MKNVYITILILSFFSCGSPTSQDAKPTSSGKSMNDTISLSQEVITEKEIDSKCQVSDSLVALLGNDLSIETFDLVKAELLYSLLKQNNLIESECHFPRNDVEASMINQFTLNLIDESSSGWEPILTLFYIFDGCRRNIELIEYIQDELANIIFLNTQGYIQMVSALDNESRVKAIGLIEFIYEKERLNNLKERLVNLKSEQNINIINSINEKISQEISRL